MTKIETYIVDSFMGKPFKGNPAGVFVLRDELSDNVMQLIAKELGLSETAFVNSLTGQNKYPIRYFSPKMEIPLCGHATLAASKVIFEKNESLSNINFINIQKLDLTVQKKGRRNNNGVPYL